MNNEEVVTVPCIMDFLYTHYEKKNIEVAQYITGSTDETSNLQILNPLLEDIIVSKSKSKTGPHIYIVIGAQDDHCIPQFLPLLQCLVKNDMKYSVIREPYITHKNLTSFFVPIYNIC